MTEKNYRCGSEGRVLQPGYSFSSRNTHDETVLAWVKSESRCARAGG